MRCWFCQSKLTWSGDFSFEDYCMDGEGIVAILSCSNDSCNAHFEGYLEVGEQNNDQARGYNSSFYRSDFYIWFYKAYVSSVDSFNSHTTNQSCANKIKMYIGE